MVTMAPTGGEVFIEPIGQVLTAEEYDALPENPRRELVDGVIHMMASPKAWHQPVKITLYNALNRLRPQEVEVVSAGSETEDRIRSRASTPKPGSSTSGASRPCPSSSFTRSDSATTPRTCLPACSRPVT